ncbi:MAG: carbohydrate-binding family 9-like protein [Melioribacteraceae bacterium]|nr:carbohydrate-binding family 9-like protein [Melioribacteraceae bacterium]MCF8264521.1 carbohydrate-binding family 9-like protein [Melioribacteraceae bacterium]
MNKNLLVLIFTSPALFFISSCFQNTAKIEVNSPLHYEVLKTESDFIIDGFASELDWNKSSWTSDFLDIQGVKYPTPRFKTRVKMLWDVDYLYIFAELHEPHIWGNITKRDEVIFYNNDFEVFIKPDQYKPIYGEIEINALNTVWDLQLPKSYRTGGKAIDDWNLTDLKTAVSINGTLNNPDNIDSCWNVEMAVPINEIQKMIGKTGVNPGEVWRINFSRVQWQHEIIDGIYHKKKNPETNKSYPEDNWVWSPQYAIDMHRPEHWGYLEFSENLSDTEKKINFEEFETEYQALFSYHRNQIEFKKQNGIFSKDINSIGGSNFIWNNKQYEIFLDGDENKYSLSIRLENNSSMKLNSDEQITFEKVISK